jgi:signal transduction histidine kinase
MQPLTAVSEHTNKLSEGLEVIDTEEELTTSLREIQVGGLRLNQLIEDFIALAELETGEAAAAYHWQAQPIANFGLLLFELCQELKPQFPETVAIGCPFNDQVPLIFGDSSLLTSCVQHLINFCVRQSANVSKSIELCVQAAADEVQVAISCSAPLFFRSEVVLQKVLECDTSSLAELPDYASNLFLVKGYVALHNGRFQYENQAEKGFVFQISLPVYKMPSETAI